MDIKIAGVQVVDIASELNKIREGVAALTELLESESSGYTGVAVSIEIALGVNVAKLTELSKKMRNNLHERKEDGNDRPKNRNW